MRDMLSRRSALKISAVAGAAGLVGNGFSLVRPAEADEPAARRWWKEAIVYQIYPKSFADSNGDGIGDLKGIIGKLDHLKDLGVNVVWLNPHFETSNIDGGYDISDYRKVNPVLGNMADFDALVAGLKERGIKLIVDLVVNHTSDEHVWFKESRKSKTNPYRDFYIWRDAKPDGSLPNNYLSFFGGSAWQKDDTTGQYYLHYFAKQQPDLNWENPKVRHEVYDIMRFWLDKGASGFRMDVIPLISKPAGLRDLAPDELSHPEYVYTSGPNVHKYIHEMNRMVLAKNDSMTVGEAFGVKTADTPKFVSSKRQELGMVFSFDTVRTGRDNWEIKPWTVVELKKNITQENNVVGPDGWPTTFFENHDNPRSVSYFADGTSAGAKALALLLLGRRGTPYIFQGQEIGMTNIPFRSLDDFEDIEGRNNWTNNVGKVPMAKLIHDLGGTSRDNARTPMQWTSDAKAGFTTGNPWFRVNPNTAQINVEAQRNDPNSVMSFYKTLIAARKAHSELVYGAFHDADPSHPAVVAFVRGSEKSRYLVLINLTNKEQLYTLPEGLVLADVVADTEGRKTVAEVLPKLGAWQGGIYTLKA